MGKKLIVNSDVCDARKVTEQTLQDYDNIIINSDLLLVDDRSRALLTGSPMIFNGDRMLEVEGEVQVNTVNGSSRIAASDVPAGCRQFLVVNGSLTIDPGTEKILDNYVGIRVNGSVTYPESLSGYMSRATVNGSAICYPDNAVILKSSTAIDRVFALRATNCLYWTRGRLLMVDPQLDPAVLAAKGARFQAKSVIVTESKVEDLINLIDEQAEILIVPDGVKVIADDLHLNEANVKHYGPRLYVLGDVKILEEDRAALERVEYLNIRGDVRVDESLRDLLLEKAEEVTGEIKCPKGRVIRGQISAKISQWLLDREPRGICIENCVSIKLDPEIPNDQILDRLTIRNAAAVTCSEEQESAVTAICENVAAIGQGNSGSILDMVNTTLKQAFGDHNPADFKDIMSAKVINSDYYVM